MIDYVTGFMFSRDKRTVVLISKIQPAWQHGHLNGVGGKTEPGESSRQAMAREFAEETGIETSADCWNPYVILTEPEVSQVHFLVAFDDRIHSARSVEKEVVGLYEAAALPGNVIGNLRWLIPMALDANLRFEKPVQIFEVRDA